MLCFTIALGSQINLAAWSIRASPHASISAKHRLVAVTGQLRSSARLMAPTARRPGMDVQRAPVSK